MGALMSTFLVLALYLLLALPLVLVFFLPRLKWAAGALYLMLGTGVAAYHLEFSAADLPPIPQPMAAMAADNLAEDPRCAKALELSEQAGIVVERKTPERFVVSARIWTQVPPQVQQALVACHAGDSGIEPQVIQR